MTVLGVGERLVAVGGVKSYNDDLRERARAGKIAKIGYGWHSPPSLDPLVAAKPDVSFMVPGDLGHAEHYERIKSLGIPVVPVFLEREPKYMGAVDYIHLIGMFADREQQAEQFATDVENRVTELKKLAASRPKKKVLSAWFSGSARWMVTVCNTENQLLEDAGGVNVMAEPDDVRLDSFVRMGSERLLEQAAKGDSIRMGSNIALAAFAAALACVSFFALSYGQVSLGFDRLTAALLVPESDPVAAQIVRDIRLPRVVTGLVAGAALGVSGVLMQALFRNPMADAWSLGLVAGGQLGVAVVVTAAAFAGPEAIAFLRAFQGIGLTAGALAGVAVFAVVMTALSRRVGNITLLVVGLMLGFAVRGLVSVIIHFANRVGGRVFSGWNDGTFASTTFADLPFLVPPCACRLSRGRGELKGAQCAPAG